MSCTLFSEHLNILKPEKKSTTIARAKKKINKYGKPHMSCEVHPWKCECLFKNCRYIENYGHSCYFRRFTCEYILVHIRNFSKGHPQNRDRIGQHHTV